jgi:hypothetical protein
MTPRKPPPTDRERALADVGNEAKERELEGHVKALCKAHGVMYFHPLDSRGTNPGFPDDVLIVHGAVMWRELKSQKGRVRPDQKIVLAALKAAGHDVDVWRPCDLLSGRIAREIAALSAARLPATGGTE